MRVSESDILKASDAATAAAGGGTVERASKEDTADTSGAIYEVHVTKADGTEVEVLEDAGFKVTATRAGHQHGGHDGDHGGPGDNDAPAATGKGTGA